MKNSPTKILIVDDEPDIVEILKYNLNNEGYDVKSAYNGKKAVEKAKKFIPDIILLDVMMPEMDGIEACVELKKISSLSRFNSFGKHFLSVKISTHWHPMVKTNVFF